MEGIIHDLRFGVRTLWRNPGFTLIAVMTLALGIGANAAMLSVTTTALFRQLPFPEPERVMVLWRDTPRLSRGAFSIPTFRDWHQRNRAFEHLAMFRSSSVNLVGENGEPERVSGLMVSADFVPALRVEPVLGRSFTAEDDRLGAGRTVMLSYEIWQRRFSGHREIVGQAIRLNGEPYTVIGVFPAGLSQERVGTSRLGDLWLPIAIFFDRLPSEDRSTRALEAIGRLAPGVLVSTAREDMARIIQGLAQEHPDTYDSNRLTGELLPEDQVSGVRPVLLILLAAVGFVLLITCSNLINLQLTRNAARDHELATRIALGAGRWHLIRQLVTEGLLLALLGGAAGLLIGLVYLRALPHLMSNTPFVEQARIDGPTTVLTFLVTVLIGALIGWIPALQALRSMRRADIAGHGLRSRSTQPHQRLRQVLTIGEMVLAVVLLIGAGLMLRTVRELRAVNPGFESDRLLTLKLVLPQVEYERGFPWLGYLKDALERLRRLPGVESAAFTSLRPIDDETTSSIAAAEDREMPKTKDMTIVTYEIVSPGYFQTLGVPLLEGRDFRDQDQDGADAEPVVIVNRTLADRLWPDESPLGKLFAFEFLGTSERPEPQWRRIVGVVGDLRNQALREAPGPAAYAPYTQRSPYFEESPTMTMVVRTRSEPLETVAALREELLAVDPHQPFFSVRTMTEVLADDLGQPKMVSAVLSSLAALALALATLGVYGVIARSVAVRTREIGTRMALGATRDQVFTAFLKRSLTFVAVGIGAGWIAAAFLTRLLIHLLYGVAAIDPLVYFASGLLLALVALLATIAPTLRATAIQPAKALRYE
jgi:putative ABC transport system permease protein